MPFFLSKFFCGTQKNYALLTQSVATVFIPLMEESKLDFLLRRKSTFIFMENKSGVGLSLKITDKKPRYIFYENILWIFGFDKK